MSGADPGFQVRGADLKKLQHHNIISDKLSDQNNEKFLSRETNRRKQEIVENG
jgi:hypothetical protein